MEIRNELAMLTRNDLDHEAVIRKAVNHIDKLETREAKLWAHNNNLKLALEQAQNGLDWYREAHPEDDSGADDEFKELSKELLEHCV